MKQVFKAGDIKVYKTVVKEADVATFHGTVVHNVCSTFALARDVEWTTRQFVLAMKEADEEGVGTYLQIAHKGPAFVGEEIIFTGKFENMTGHELICSFEARVGDRIVARGKTGQKILKRETINAIFRNG
jgi:fluoroacetyl-CoA thioesterase